MDIGSQRSSRTGPVPALFILLVLAILVSAAGEARAASFWVDPIRGSDDARGTRGNPLRSVTEAWQRLPTVASEPTRIELKAGSYRGLSPIYWEDHSGRAGAPITIRSVDGRGRARLPAVNLFGVSHLEFRGIQFSDGGDVVHCERCSHFTLRKVIALGRDAQEVVKVNQSDNIQILSSKIVGAGDNGIDLVAVQRARIRNNVVRESGDWCAYAKGGSVDVVVTGNLFTRCGTGGFSAGQGTGFQFMVRPWLQYEAIGVVVRGNTVTRTEGAAFGIQGGFNVLVADNVARWVGKRSHVLEAVYGLRSCDGQPGDDGRERCQEYLDSGGWGTTVVDDGTNAVRIPNRHAFFTGNVILNPAPYRSEWQQLQVFGPIGSQPGTNVPADAAGDSDLRFIGNVVWNGPPDMPLGIGEDGCRPSNPTCNPGLVEGQNRFNRRLPSVRELRNGRLRATGWAADYTTQASEPVPIWSDLPAGTAPWRAWPR
ncbi:MAG: right-handed parallel beta-helix repeat-containing protein [Solirubrobacterales bacterium]